MYTVSLTDEKKYPFKNFNGICNPKLHKRSCFSKLASNNNPCSSKNILDRGAQLKFDPQSITAVAAQGVISNQALITNGSWNRSNTFSMQTAGQEFVLQLHEKAADALPADMNVALQTPASEVTLWEAPNKLDGNMKANGQPTDQAALKPRKSS